MAPPLVQGEDLYYVKSFYLVPFAYFGIDSQLTSDFYYYLEYIDTEFTHKIDVKKWCDQFCPLEKDVFLAIWLQYYIGRKTFETRDSSMGNIGMCKCVMMMCVCILVCL